MAPDPRELTDRQACLVLNALPGLGPVSLHRLLEACGGDPRDLLAGDPSRFRSVPGVRAPGLASLASWRDALDPVREEERMARAGVRFILRDDPEYPGLLRETHDPPLGLYARGRPVGARLCIAMVGCRNATLYGQAAAGRLAADLVRMGFCVVSGLARGIDTAAHEGALAGGGLTAAVMATGMDIVYPPENVGLYRRVGETGIVLTESPFGRPADRQAFPRRNRIIAGMSTAVIVVESDLEGGAMITAQLAGELGRPLFAVPGRIDQPTSAGCNRLIREGATLLSCAEDLLTELPYLADRVPAVAGGSGETGGGAAAGTDAESVAGGEGGVDGVRGRPAAAAGTDVARVLACFRGGGSMGTEGLASASGLPAAAVAASLVRLEVEGRVARRVDGRYEAVQQGR